MLALCSIVLIITYFKYRQLINIERKVEKRHFFTHHKYTEEKEKVKREIKETYYSDLETDIDRLYRLVTNKGSVKLSLAAGALKIDKVKLKEWALILEKHNMIKIHYPIIGEPELRSITK